MIDISFDISDEEQKEFLRWWSSHRSTDYDLVVKLHDSVLLQLALEISEQPEDQTNPPSNWYLVTVVYDGQILPFWDGSAGPLWAVWGNCGHWSYPIGIVRAESLEQAWEFATDEIFPDPDDDELQEYERSCRFCTEGEWPDLPEGWSYRSGVPMNGRDFPDHELSTLYAVRSLDIADPVARLQKSEIGRKHFRFVWGKYDE